MKNWNSMFFLCLVLLAFCSFKIMAGVARIDSKTPVAFLDDELTRVVTKPNKWGYMVTWYPRAFDAGLTYWIKASIAFKEVRLATVDQAEDLFVDVYKDFIQNMNAVRSIRPYLNEFPLTPANCTLVLRFDTNKGGPVGSPYIHSIIFDKGQLQLGTASAFNEKNPSDSKEMFYRSAQDNPELKALYQPKCPRLSVGSKIEIPTFSSACWRYNLPVFQNQISFLKELCDKTNLSLTTLGCVGQHYFDSHLFQFAVRGSHTTTQLNEAQALTARLNKELLDYTSKDQSYKDYVKLQYGPNTLKEYPSPTPIPEYLAYRISFWDENIDRPVAPYIAEIRLLDKKLSYFTADENQRLVLVFEETFEDSMKGTSN